MPILSEQEFDSPELAHRAMNVVAHHHGCADVYKGNSYDKQKQKPIRVRPSWNFAWAGTTSSPKRKLLEIQLPDGSVRGSEAS
jgi:hypothetical protein